jgi:hypothetical protein
VILHWNTSITEVFKATCVVEVQMPENHSFDVFNVVPSLLDLRGEVHGFVVVYAGEDVVDWGPYILGVVLHHYSAHTLK